MSSHNYRLLIAPQAQQDIISILRFVYRMQDEVISVVRVLHQRMSLRRHI
jgi:plasmid stabilization system protein ParE